MRKVLLKLSVIAILIANLLFSVSCTAKDLQCTKIVDMRELSKPIDGKEYVITLESDYILVDEKTFKYYSIGDTFCK